MDIGNVDIACDLADVVELGKDFFDLTESAAADYTTVTQEYLLESGQSYLPLFITPACADVIQKFERDYFLRISTRMLNPSEIADNRTNVFLLGSGPFFPRSFLAYLVMVLHNPEEVELYADNFQSRRVRLKNRKASMSLIAGNSKLVIEGNSTAVCLVLGFEKKKKQQVTS
ncbi:hypothetical protein MW887_009930 [Aspergillus wentii]|nr:hypothetical protein MW887_009930 [Aspergillus wentii]